MLETPPETLASGHQLAQRPGRERSLCLACYPSGNECRNVDSTRLTPPSFVHSSDIAWEPARCQAQAGCLGHRRMSCGAWSPRRSWLGPAHPQWHSLKQDGRPVLEDLGSHHLKPGSLWVAERVAQGHLPLPSSVLQQTWVRPPTCPVLAPEPLVVCGIHVNVSSMAPSRQQNWTNELQMSLANWFFLLCPSPPPPCPAAAWVSLQVALSMGWGGREQRLPWV